MSRNDMSSRVLQPPKSRPLGIPPASLGSRILRPSSAWPEYPFGLPEYPFGLAAPDLGRLLQFDRESTFVVEEAHVQLEPARASALPGDVHRALEGQRARGSNRGASFADSTPL